MLLVVSALHELSIEAQSVISTYRLRVKLTRNIFQEQHLVSCRLSEEVAIEVSFAQPKGSNRCFNVLVLHEVIHLDF